MTSQDPPWASIQPLELTDPHHARQLHALQQKAYAQEAALLQVQHFPPLTRTVSQLQSSGERYRGVWRAEQLMAAIGHEADESGDGQTIASLVVDPTQQRQGLGRLLLGGLLSSLPNQAFSVSTASGNLPALALYGGMGFVEYSRRRVGPEQLELITLRRPPTHAD